MSSAGGLDVARLARLARLSLGADEARALAAECEAIAHSFSALEAYAASLPEPPAQDPAPPRADEATASPAEEVEGILRAVPRLDAGSRKIVVPRGLP